MSVIRRTRGVVLRAALRRRTALMLGILLAAPAAWLEFFSRLDVWWVDGLSLVLGATGCALIWAGLTGARPDWIDEAGERPE